MIQITLTDLQALETKRLPGEKHRFVEKHLTPPQFLDEHGKIHSARKDKEQVKLAGPDSHAVAAEHRKLSLQLNYESYRSSFLLHLLETNHD